MAYWYANADGKDTFAKLKDSDLIVTQPPAIKGVEGAIEAEKMKVKSVSGGNTQHQQGAGDAARV